MLIHHILTEKSQHGMPEPEHVPGIIDPALLTIQQYSKIANSDDKWHPSEAYNVTLARMNQFDPKPEEWPRIVRNLRINGLMFQIRAKSEHRGYYKCGPNGEPLGEHGNRQLYTDAEARELGRRTVRWDIAVFNDDKQQIAAIQDEWGCLLVMVAQEYRSFGFGQLLVGIARTLEPEQTSGGFTPAGYNNFVKVHRSFVRKAMASGQYSALVRQGVLTTERVREIISSAKIDTPRTKRDRNLRSDDPKDYMLYVGQYGDFVLYDRKIKDLIAEGGEINERWIESMVRGIVYVTGTEEWLTLRQFGGDTVPIRRLLVRCAIEYARREDMPLYLEPEDIQYIPPGAGTAGSISNRSTGFKAALVTPSGQEFDYDPLGIVERRFRKSFDQYDEFKSHVVELAYAKYQQQPQAEVRSNRSSRG